MAERFSVLLVGADALVADAGAALEAAGAIFEIVETPGAAIAAIAEAPPSVVLAAQAHALGALLEYLRHEAPRYVPLIMLAPTRDPGALVAGFAAGADDVLTFPSAEELLARVKHHVAMKRRLDHAAEETERLRALSLTDGLTEIANHRAFQDRLRDEFRRAQRYDHPLALIMVDVDHFKQVNDTHGHQLGDQVLVGIARALRHAIRETDFVARYGGEEFAAILPSTHLAGALTVAERISQDVRAVRAGPEGALRVTASFGLSGYPGRGVNTPEQLIKTADEALFRAKDDGRNKIRLYQPGPPSRLTA